MHAIKLCNNTAQSDERLAPAGLRFESLRHHQNPLTSTRSGLRRFTQPLLVLILGAATVVLTGTPACAASTARSIEITIEPQWSAAPRALAITVSFAAAGRRATDIVLPREWAGATNLQDGIRSLRVLTAGARLADGNSATTRRIEHRPTGRVTLAYELVDMGGDTFADHARFYRPLLRPEYTLFFGHGAWVLPAGAPEQVIDLTLTLKALPADWSALSSFGAQTAPHTGAITWRARSVTRAGIDEALIALGDFRAREFAIEGKPVWIALRGAWSFDDLGYFAHAANLVRVQRQFFHERSVPFYLITLLQSDKAGGDYGGTAVFNAFAMYSGPDFKVASDAFRFLVTHEHLHMWVPQRMGPMSLLPQDEDEALRYWFSEGFDNYLSHRLLLAAGEWSLEDYAHALNDVIRRYETSPARTLPNAALPERFFKDNAAGEMPYQRGELLALHWDRALRARGTSLDAVLRRLVRPANAPPLPKVDASLATNRLLAEMARTLGAAPRAEVERLIERAEPFTYSTDLLGPCFEGAPARYPAFELGFAPQSFLAKRVSGLIAGSAADRAGLRDGDEVTGYSVRRGEPDQEAKVEVKRDGEIVPIRFYPRAATEVDAFRYTPRAEAANDVACRRWREVN